MVYFCTAAYTSAGNIPTNTWEDNWGGAFDNDPMPGFHSSTEQGIWLREEAKQEFYKYLRSKGYHEEKVKRP